MAEQIGLEGVFSLDNWSKNIGRYQSDLNKATSETNKAAGSFGKSWDQMGKTVANVTKTMGVALVAAGAAAGAAVAGFAVSGIQKAADLEAQMSNIAAIFNTTAENVKPLNDLILELGIDPNLKVSTMEAAEAIEMLGKNGLTMAEIMDGAAHSTVLLANATGADFGVAADIATDVMAIFGIEAANMGAAVDGITAVTVASKFTIDDYRLAIAQAGGVAGAVGVDFDDFNTTIAAISPSFASGSDAGTSFKTMLQRLIPQSTEAAEMMNELGLSGFDTGKAMEFLSDKGIKPVSGNYNELVTQMMQVFGASHDVNVTTAEGIEKFQAWATETGIISNKFFDANGNMKSMNEIAVLLNGALAGLSEEQKLQAVTTLAGADASRAMLGLMDAGAVVYTDAAVAAKALGVSQEEVNKVIEGGVTQFEALQLTMGQTDAAQQAATRMDNFRGAMEILGGVIETLQIQIGQAFLPALTELARAFTDLVSQNSDKIVGFFQALADNIVALVGYFTEVATSGDTFNAKLNEMSPGFANIVQKATELSLAIGTTLRDAFKFVQEHADAFKGVLIGIGSVLAAATITSGITTIVATIGTLFTPVGLLVLAAAGLGWAWSTNWLGMRDKTIEAVDAIKATFQPLTDAITTFGSGALTEIQAFVTGNETEFTNVKAIWDGAKESFGNAFTGIQTTATSLLDYLKEQFPALTPVFDGFQSAVSLVFSQVGSQFTLLQDSTSALVSLVTSLIEGDWAGAWQSAQDLAGAFVTYVTDTFTNLKSVFETPFGEIKTLVTDTFTGLVTTVGEQLPGWKTQLGEWGTAASQWIADASVIVAEKMAEWKTAVVDYVVENLPSWIATLKEWGDAAWQWIVDAVPVVTTKLGEWWTALTGYIAQQFPTWQTQFTEWTTALWEWIVDAVPLVATELGKWWTEISGYLTNTALPAFTTQMLEWATALVSWIGSAAADALPKLGEWLGKITAWVVIGAALLVIEMAKFATAIISWIPGAIAQLPGKIAELKDALIGWIAGTGGTEGGTGTLVGEAPTAMDKFKTALINALTGIKEGFIGAVQGFVRSFSDTLSEYIDWEFVGSNIMTSVRNGITSMRTVIVEKLNEIVASLGAAWTTVVDWLQTGKDVIKKVVEGLQEMLTAGSLAAKAGELVASAAKAFTEFDWKATGIAIITGIKKGLEEKGGEIVSFLTGLGSQALDAIKGLFGIESPSKVMAEIGRNIIDGWVLGMANNEHRVLAAMQKISLGVSKIAHRAGEDAISAFTSALGSFSQIVGDEDSGLGGMIRPGAPGSPENHMKRLLAAQQGRLRFLEMQGSIIQAVRDAGLDPADVLGGLTLGANADPMKLAGVVGKTMEALNRQLEQALKNSVSGLDKTIDEMREGRKSITDIEEEFTKEHLSVLGNYANRLEQIDEQIAQAEEQTLRTGGAGMQHLRTLQSQRDRLLAEVKEFHEQRIKMEDLLTKVPTSDNTRAQDAMDRWRAQWLDPLINLFQEGDIFTRRAMMPAIQENLRKLQAFSHQIARITNVESQAMLALEGFGQGARGRVENLLTAMYDPNQTRTLDANINALRKFSQELHTIKATLGGMARNRESTDSIIERFMGGVDQLQMYKNAIAGIDEQISRAQEHSLATGSIASLASIRQLDVTRKKSQQELETFLRQTERLADIMGQVRNLSGPGQASAERFLQEMIQPIADAFNGPMRSQEREAWLRSAQDRVDALNRFVLQMRQVERLQARVAGNQAFTHLADDFALLQDMLMPENTRAGLIVHLDDYITQMMRLHEIQQDITQGRGINPLVDRFASERLDSIAKRLEDINLSEMERNRLIQEYRVEQEKILRLQQKQQQLDFINQQLALIEQLRSLDDEEGWSVDVENILSGIRFGVNASIDDLMMLTGRVLDELVKFANHELGIASPSRVFARVGENIMAGLAAGVESGLRMPMNALRNAAGSLVPYSLQQRALTINMGGVTINDRIDAALFENRIRQVVRSEFAT